MIHARPTPTDTRIAEALLRPRSVALVGVSDSAAKTAGRPLRFLRQSGFAGTVYPVNPHRDQVQGERAWPSLDALPEVPDHVFILTGTDAALAALDDCNRLGVPVATILAGGFSEAGPEGAEKQRRLDQIIAQSHTRILGPSSIGVVNLNTGLTLTANAAFAEPDLTRGSVFVASQSGSLIGALLSRGKARGHGFAGLVSVGGEADLSIGEICSATLDDPSISGYLLFLEALTHADRLRAFAVAAAARGKPVVAYKLGRTEQGAELTVSHTGALAGADQVADTFLRDCGIVRVDAFDSLLDILPLMGGALPDHAGPARVGVVTTTGGGAAMAVDRLALRGLDVCAPTAETRARLAAAGIDAHGRIVDLTLAGTRYEVMKAALDILLEAPEFDVVLATVGSSARFNPDLAVQPIIDAAASHARPLAAFVVPDAPQALRALAAAGIAGFSAPEVCADVLAAALSRRAPRVAAQTPAAPVSAATRTLDEGAAYALLDRAGIAHAPFVVLDCDAPVPDLPFGWPVVAKVLHPDIAHKSDLGGVVLHIPDRAALVRAMLDIRARVQAHRPDLQVHQVLVQPMLSGLGEMLVGIRRDPQAGPVVMLAAGGVQTELYNDTSLRLAPVDLATAHEMIAEVRASRLFTGFRGKPRGDLAALAEVIVAMSRLSAGTDPVVIEGEINPLLILPETEGVVSVDGLFRIATA